jgi:uncharacterized membrane protein YkgB
VGVNLKRIDQKLIDFFKRTYLPVARISLFIVFFWFGFLKLLDISPAGALAVALTDKTIGVELFYPLYTLLAALECAIGILILIPKAVRVTIPLLFIHLIIVCSPLLLLPELTWQKPFVPTLEGQYILKNVLIIAVAFGIAAHTDPWAPKSPSVKHKKYN